MSAMDRRMMLRTLLGAAAAASVGLTLAPEFAEAAPLPVGKLPEAQPETLIERARHVVHHHHHHHRHWRHGHVHHRRHVCWWHRGRRVCGWR